MIDSIDRDIIRALAGDARLTNQRLGALVGLSPNAAGARVQKLRRDGVISGFHASVDHAVLGRPMAASIDIWLRDHDDHHRFRSFVCNDDRIIECFLLTGPLDYRIRVRVASATDLNDLIQSMQNEGGVRQTDSRLVLEQLPVAQST